MLLNADPEVETEEATPTGLDSINVRGNLLDLGTQPIKQHGFIYSTSPKPTLEVDGVGVTKLGSLATTGTFISSVTGLKTEQPIMFVLTLPRIQVHFMVQRWW